MKKIIRIILSPIHFAFVFCAINIFPVGFLCLWGGLFQLLGKWIMNKEIEDFDVIIIFTFILLPIIETKKFIQGEESVWS